MSIRPVKRVVEATPHHRGRRRQAAPRLRLRRHRPSSIRSCCSTTSATSDPDDYLAGFPWHPHRGIETITYVLAGTVEHGDSLGNRGSLGAGDVQWMTAGSGIIHQEMPQGDAQGRMHGFQLWANLPRVAQDDDAALPGHRRTRHPRGHRRRRHARARRRAATSGAKQGPVEGVAADPRYLDVSVPPGTQADAAGRDVAARLRLRLRRRGHVPRRVRAARRATDSVGDDGADSGRAATTGRATARSCCSTAATRSPCRPATKGIRFLLVSRQAARGAGRLVRPDRDEHRSRSCGRR